MKATQNIALGKKINRLPEIPLNKVVKLYGTVGVNLAGKDVIIQGYYRNAQGLTLLVKTPSSPVVTKAIQAYEASTGIATYTDQADADRDFTEKVAEYKAAFDAKDWATCRELKELNG